MKKPHRSIFALFSTTTLLPQGVASSVHPIRRITADDKQLTAGQKLSQALMSLCEEIAGTLLRRTGAGEEAALVRREIETGLRQHLSCPDLQLKAIVDMSIELIHVKSYGRYHRNALELAYLIDLCAGQVGEMGSN